MKREMTVTGLTIDPLTNSPIIILKDLDGEHAIPIWIGLLEATAIACELEQIKFSRPMTHDLYKNTISQLGYKVAKVEVVDLRDSTYFAQIYLESGDQETSIDARPSDAIAIALRSKAPIFVNQAVIDKSKALDKGVEEAIKTDEGKKWTEILEGLDQDDFGKYKM